MSSLQSTYLNDVPLWRVLNVIFKRHRKFITKKAFLPQHHDKNSINAATGKRIWTTTSLLLIFNLITAKAKVSFSDNEIRFSGEINVTLKISNAAITVNATNFKRSVNVYIQGISYASPLLLFKSISDLVERLYDINKMFK